MKYKKRLENLRNRVGAWEKAGTNYQKAHKKPGSQKK